MRRRQSIGASAANAPALPKPFTAEAIDVSGQKDPIRKEIALAAGELDTLVVSFSELATGDVGFVRMEISNVESTGPCGSVFAERLVEALSGATRIISNFMSRRGDQIFSDDAPGFDIAGAQLFVSGNPADESVELAFNLRELVVMDGLRKLMAPSQCEAVIRLRAAGYSESGELAEIFFGVCRSTPPGSIG